MPARLVGDGPNALQLAQLDRLIGVLETRTLISATGNDRNNDSYH
jgi:hypothetical protein